MGVKFRAPFSRRVFQRVVVIPGPSIFQKRTPNMVVVVAISPQTRLTMLGVAWRWKFLAPGRAEEDHRPGAWTGPSLPGCVFNFHLLKICVFNFPLLVLKGIYHYWKYFYFFLGSEPNGSQ